MLNKAFSLVELSIVLVILGLLTGGILAGQSLIRAAELRSVTSDIQRYQAAIGTFRDKYLALPGDMQNAVRFWGAQAGGTADGLDGTCSVLTTAATGTATCNGNGDGRIWGTPSATNHYEMYRTWQHLASAGLIEGQYSGVNGGAAANWDHIPGTNSPRGRIGNSGFALYWLDPGFSNANEFALNYMNFFVFGGRASGSTPITPILRPEEVWNIDTKLDDGRPGFGRVFSWKGGTSFIPNCVSTDVAATAEYRLTETGQTCIVGFLSGY